MEPQLLSNGEIQDSTSGTVATMEIFNKRKAVPYIEHCLSYPQFTQSAAAILTIIPIFDFPHKRQKQDIYILPRGLAYSKFEQQACQSFHLTNGIIVPCPLTSLSRTAPLKPREATYHEIETIENNSTAPDFQDSSTGTCSSVSCWSDDNGSSSTRSFTSSRSSSPSLQCGSIDSAPLADIPQSFKDQDLIIRCSSGSQPSNPFSLDPSALNDQICPLSDAVCAIRNEGIIYRDIENIQSPDYNGRDVNHRGSLGTSVTPNTVQPTSSHTMNEDEQVEDSGSSESPTSSTTSDTCGRNRTTKIERRDKLEAFIKDEVLRTDPEVAELFYEEIKGELEYTNSDDIERPHGGNELSLLHLIELEAFGIVQPSGAITSCASTSSDESPSPTSNFGQATVPASSSGSQSTSASTSTGKEITSNNGEPSQQVKSEQSNSKPGVSDRAKSRGLRCIHNALLPNIFCINQNTQQKFRSCPGPGYLSIQHVKEHMRNHHTKRVKKLNPLQCSQCQGEFPDQEALRLHTDAVDCPIRCLECSEEFESKASRLSHQKLSHSEEESGNGLMELDEKMWKKLKDETKVFKQYSDSLKKGKTAIKARLEEWISANTAAFEAGRTGKVRADSRNELGQWYTLYTTFAPHSDIPEHPFYDYSSLPQAEYAEEKIVNIHRKLKDKKIQAHGPPPADPESQSSWWEDVMIQSIRIAAKTTMKVKDVQPAASPSSMSTSLSAQGSGVNSQQRPSSDLGLVTNNISAASQSSGIHNLHGMGLQTQDYLSSAQQLGGMTGQPNSLTDSSIMGVGMSDTWSYYQEGDMHDSSQFHMDTLCMEYFEQNPQDPFEFPECDILDDDSVLLQD